MRALGCDCSRRTGESSQAKVHRGHPLEGAMRPYAPPRSRSWAAVAPVNNSISAVKMDEVGGQPAEPRKLYRKSLGHAKLHCHCFVVGAWPLCVSGCRCRWHCFLVTALEQSVTIFAIVWTRIGA